jgi:putative ABC transport system substrate-binding protein
VRRREFIILIGGAVAASPLAARAQQKAIPVIGVLHQTSPEQGARAAGKFREGMRSRGWIEGSTVTIEDRFANGDSARLAANAVELVTAKVDVIVAFSGLPARAARQATLSIPIVMDTGDPVGLGMVASLARPGGNITGQSLMRTDMAAKQLQMLKEACRGQAKSASYCNPIIAITYSR